MGLGSFAKAASKAPVKKKDDKPHFDVPELNDALNDWLEAKKMQQDGKALQQKAENDILEEAETRRLSKSLEDHKNYSTVVINDKVMVNTKNAYKAISDDDIAELRDTFGADADRFFRQKMSISFNEEGMQNEELINKVIEAVGEENLAKYFDIKQVYVPTEAFHDERSTNPEIAAKAQEVISEGLVSPYKAAVRKL